MANESNNNNSELKAFFVQHGTKIAVAFVVIFALIAGIVQYKEARKVAAAEQSELIGVGLTYLYANEKDSALVEFENKIASGKLEGLALAKASLLAANIKYEKKDFDGAALLFQNLATRKTATRRTNRLTRSRWLQTPCGSSLSCISSSVQATRLRLLPNVSLWSTATIAHSLIRLASSSQLSNR